MKFQVSRTKQIICAFLALLMALMAASFPAKSVMALSPSAGDPSPYIQSARALINDLLNNGQLSSHYGAGIKRGLHMAQVAYNAGDYQKVTIKLSSFVKTVQWLVDKGHLSSMYGEDLVSQGEQALSLFPRGGNGSIQTRSSESGSPTGTDGSTRTPSSEPGRSTSGTQRTRTTDTTGRNR